MKKFKEFWNASYFIRKYILKYKTYYFWGIFSLLIVDIFDVIHPLIIKKVIDAIEAKESIWSIVYLSSLYLVVILVKTVGRYYWRIYFNATSFMSAADFRFDFFKKLTTLTGNFFSKTHSGDLMSLATNDVDSLRNMLGPGMLILLDAIMYLAVVPALLIYLSPKLALYTFITLPVIPFIIAKMSSLIHDRWEKVQDQFSEVTTFVHENISGIRINKSYNAKEFQTEKLKVRSELYKKKLIDYAIIHSFFHPMIEMIFEIGVVIFVIFGGILTIKGGVSLGLFVAFRSYINRLTWPMVAIGWVTSMYNRAAASNKRLEEVTKLDPEITESKDIVVKEPYLKDASSIEIKNLDFKIGDTQILKNISFKIEKGETIGIMGEIGSGKSIFTNLLLRLFEVPDNSIFIDGIDIKKYSLKALRSKIAIVPQEVFLFSDSIRNNITFANANIDLEEIKNLTRKVEFHNDITRFPNEYDTMLGEKGINLSGGQKQRVSIARALASRSSILVFDDAFSSIDTEVEEEILKNLKTIIKEKTTIIVSHRISTLKYADRILILKQGSIEEFGTQKRIVTARWLLFQAF